MAVGDTLIPDAEAALESDETDFAANIGPTGWNTTNGVPDVYVDGGTNDNDAVNAVAGTDYFALRETDGGFGQDGIWIELSEPIQANVTYRLTFWAAAYVAAPGGDGADPVIDNLVPGTGELLIRNSQFRNSGGVWGGDTHVITSTPGEPGLTLYTIDWTPLASSNQLGIWNYEDTNDPNIDDTIFIDNIQITQICFTAGTLIETEAGPRAVETLEPGDMVVTRDHGLQPLRWIGVSRRIGQGKFAPIHIAAGTLGNDRDLRVSPQHRMLLTGWRAELMFGEPGVLATAQSLVNGTTVTRAPCAEVDYVHILFDRHEIVYAEGAPSESFHPGELGMGGLDDAVRAEIFALFPDLATGDYAAYGPAVRMSLKAGEGQVMAEALG